MKKRTVSILMTLIMVICVFAPTSFAYETNAAFQDSFGGKSFDVIKGIAYTCSQLTDTGSIYIPYYYSDGFFEEASTQYNDHLATASVYLAIEGLYYSSVSGTSLQYPYRNTVIRQFLTDIGCADESVYINDLALVKPTSHTIGVAMANKKLRYADGNETGYILMPISVRGMGYEDEWISNFTVGNGSEAQFGEAVGFAEATTIVMEEIDKYLDEYELKEAAEKGKVKFWLSGQSRGGAVSNMAAKRLVDIYGTESVYAYPLEGAMGGTEAAKKPGTDYSCIHNITNYADVVTKVAPAYMGFIAYGENHYLAPMDKADYDEQIKKVRKQLKAIDPAYVFGDDGSGGEPTYSDKFEFASIDTGLLDLVSKLISGADVIKSVSYTTNDSPSKLMGDFEATFLDKLCEWGGAEHSQLNEPFILNGHTYPSNGEAITEIGTYVFDMSSGERDKFAEKLKGITEVSGFATDASGLLNDMKIWNRSFLGVSESKKEADLKKLWSYLTDKTGAIPEDDREELEDVWMTAGNLLMSFLYMDNKTQPKTYGYSGVSDTLFLAATLANNGIDVFYNHDYNMNLAWIRSYDSYYENETAPLAKPADIALTAPTAQIGETMLSTSAAAPTVVPLDAEISLDIEDVTGETIFYTVYDAASGEAFTYTISDNAGKEETKSEYLYHRCLTLPFDSESEGYKISVYAMLNGKGMNQSKADYYVKIDKNRMYMTETDSGISYRLYENETLSEVNLLVSVYGEDGKFAGYKTEIINLSSGDAYGTIEIEKDAAQKYGVFCTDSDFSPVFEQLGE